MDTVQCNVCYDTGYIDINEFCDCQVGVARESLHEAYQRSLYEDDSGYVSDSVCEAWLLEQTRYDTCVNIFYLLALPLNECSLQTIVACIDAGDDYTNIIWAIDNLI